MLRRALLSLFRKGMAKDALGEELKRLASPKVTDVRSAMRISDELFVFRSKSLNEGEI
jgi:hypothetical protein